ncbi:alpha/beta fold hydrolase [Terribacillus halophilus]|uniref:alpha/beta fold hydrolase n=1 Tax=Terribacillus halophilus TaxID=361279 RepID=UPI0009848210|nr:alpha/beta hydrolase [Terribacillus halophilus]
MSCSTGIFYFNGVAVDYKTYPSYNTGTSKTILLLHGFLASQYCFHHLIPELRRNYRVLTLDFPPFGQSGKHAETAFSYDDYTSLLSALLTHLDIGRLDIAGHSMGGQIAMRFSYHYPKIVNQLYLFAPSSYMLPTDSFSSLVASSHFFPSFIKLIFEAGSVVRFLQHLVASPNSISLRMVVAYSIPFMDQRLFSSLATFIQHRGGDLPNDCIQQIQTPATIFWGSQDPLLPPSIGYRLLAEMPKATLHVFPDAGHLLPEEIPDTLTAYMM